MAGLAPTKDGVRVRLAQRNSGVTDGPFTESKEVIGGWVGLRATEFMSCTGNSWSECEGKSEVPVVLEQSTDP
jgi:hypothetical protein